ncbi:MAG TPA: hypothetical protein VLU43_18780 [Anaeromyxobacteraceae bacterium]|nr:hypothetical protein [Anaeromyxobacteraceae bacterium]
MIPVLVAALLAAASPTDTVYTVDGGRIVGTVLEESPTSGVTIQTPDGSVRRIDRAQVSRIEFSDGTVSTPRPAPAPAPAPEAAPAARPPAAEGPVDGIFFAAGGRVRGTVIEESARSGVKVRLLDGSIHTYAPDEIARIEYADGTVSNPHPSQSRAPEAAAAPRSQSTEPPLDVVYFLGGGRVRGTVIEENPKTGVKVRLLDGSVHTYSRDELVRIEYADGTVSKRKTPAPPPIPMLPPQPAAAQPPMLPPPHHEKPQLVPFYLTLGVGATFFGGNAEAGVPMSHLFEPQAHLSSEIGLRFTPAFALGVYGDVGGADPSSSLRDQCRTQGIDCVGATGRFGVLIRHTWDPLESTAKWISLGTGWEVGGVTVDHRDGRSSDLFTYSGREYVRFGAGVDFRSNQVIGLGLYGSIAVGEYDQYKDPSATIPLDRRTHTTGQVGLRLTLFP